MQLLHYWRAIVGGLVTGVGLLMGVVRFAGDVDFVIALFGDPPWWISSMLNWLVAPPPWAPLAAVVIGGTLIWLDNRRRKKPATHAVGSKLASQAQNDTDISQLRQAIRRLNDTLLGYGNPAAESDAVLGAIGKLEQSQHTVWDVPPLVSETPDCDYAARGSLSIWSRRNWAGERWPCRSISQFSL
jgi:hypothetical protein